VKICVIGAGHVGSTIVEALHDEHQLTVVDTDATRLTALSYRYDIVPVQGSGASRRTLQSAGLPGADLLIACTARDEINVIAAMFAKGLSPQTQTVVRTTDAEYIDVWRERQLDVDFIVSSELETAYAVSHIIGLPAARQTDVFADGQVQIVEFAVDERHGRPDVIGPTLSEARIPADSKVAGIVRGGEVKVPRGSEAIRPGDRIVVIGSPAAAGEWSRIIGPEDRKVSEVVVFGAGGTGVAVATLLLEQGIDIKLVEANRERAVAVAELLPGARCYHALGTDHDFLERERIDHAQAAVFAMGDDARNHFAATLAKVQGVPFTIAIVRDATAREVFEQAGIDVTIDPRSITAEEIVRFAHDPRVRQLAMLQGDRFEVLDIVVRPESDFAGMRFRDMPIGELLIGALIRDGRALFPHGDDVLLANDRAIIFTPSSRVEEVERGL
jgi:trk system potassium uptake protein TrkA